MCAPEKSGALSDFARPSAPDWHRVFNLPSPVLVVQKCQHFFVADDAIRLVQYCMKSCSKNTLTKEEILFIYCLSRNRCVIENMFGTWINRLSIFASRATLAPVKLRLL